MPDCDHASGKPESPTHPVSSQLSKCSRTQTGNLRYMAYVHIITWLQSLLTVQLLAEDHRNVADRAANQQPIRCLS